MEYDYGTLAVREVVLDEDRYVVEPACYDGSDCLIKCRNCATKFVETFETDACPSCQTEEY